MSQGNLSYINDDLNRLTQATRPLTGDPDETFQYDPIGNRLSRDGQAVNSVFDDANRLSDDTAFTYTHDANGNLIQKTSKTTGEVTDYTWDVQSQLVKVEQRPSAGATATQTIQYRYDPMGKRIQKDINGIQTKYIYDGRNILLEYSGADVLQARYTHGVRSDEPLVVNRGGLVDYFYHSDGLGSITELTDSTGNIVQSYVYDSFGNVNVFDQNGAVISIENGIVNPFTYTGRELDTETGLYYHRARYYDSNVGRFISEDPIGFDGDGTNLFGYVLNDPINFIDHEGKAREKTFWEPCNACEIAFCRDECGDRKLDSCASPRISDPLGTGLIFPPSGKPSCSCQDPDDPGHNVCITSPFACATIVVIAGVIVFGPGAVAAAVAGGVVILVGAGAS